MNNTPNINLSTYTSDPNDKFNLLVTFNNNMTKIDTAVGAQNDQIEVIEETASTAVTTANTASATASEALQTAGTKASIDDNLASASTTYSSNKINDLIEGIEPGTEIDDTVTSTTKTWSSSKINTEISAKASINDTTAGATTTYSSNKSNDLYCKKPNYSSSENITGETSDLYSRVFYSFGINLPEGWYKLYFGCSAKTDTAPNDFKYVNLKISDSGNEILGFYTEDVTQHYSSVHFPVIRYDSPLFYHTGGQISCEVKFDERTASDHKPSNMVCILTRFNPVE